MVGWTCSCVVGASSTYGIYGETSWKRATWQIEGRYGRITWKYIFVRWAVNLNSKWIRILHNDRLWYFVVCQLELLLLIVVWCDLEMGDSITRKGFWQVWEHSCYPANLQESAVLEAQCQVGDRQGATAAVLPSKPASDSWQIPPEQGTGPRTGCTHGSGELNVSSFMYVLHITIEQGWS